MKCIWVTQVVCLVVIAGMFLGESNAAEAVPGVTDTEVVIGAHTVESGRFADGVFRVRALKGVFDEVNQAGGVHGRKIKFITIDTQSVHLKTVQATQALVEKDNIFAMVAAQGMSHQAVWKYLADKGVPDLYVQDDLSEYVNPVKKTLFLAWFDAQTEGTAVGKHIVKKMKGKKICFLTPETTTSIQFADATLKAIEEANKSLKKEEQLTIGLKEKVDVFATQVNPEILRLRNAKCDGIVISNAQARAAAAVNFAMAQGFSPKWFTRWNNVGPFLDLVDKKAAEGLIATTMVASDDGMGAKDFPKYLSLMKKLDNKVGVSSARGHFEAELFVETLKRAGKNLTRESLIKAAESIQDWTCSVCLAPIKMSPTQHAAIHEPILLVVKDGKFVRLKE